MCCVCECVYVCVLVESLFLRNEIMGGFNFLLYTCVYTFVYTCVYFFSQFLHFLIRKETE